MAASENTLDKRLECPVCLDLFERPIRQCVIGHSFCGKCLDPMNVKICPECRSQVIETRNYKLEELLDTLPLPCPNKTAGCPYVLTKEEMSKHVLECKHRIFKCEGKQFCNWKCNWEGHNILEHFKSNHKEHTSMEFTTAVTVPYNDANEFSDIQIISAHYQLFWYKHKIDLTNKKAYWAFQIIGPRKNASYYYYEFEIYNERDPIKKFKVTEYCASDLEDIDDIFKTEKCVVISFAMLKNYIDSKQLYSFRFRLMKKPNPEKQRSKSSTRQDTRSKKADDVRSSQNTNRIQQTSMESRPNWFPLVPHRIDMLPPLNRYVGPNVRYQRK